MSDYKLSLKKRTLSGKKSKSLQENGEISSVIYGQGMKPILTQSEYLPTLRVIEAAGYHSSIDLDLEGKNYLVIVKNVSVNPVKRTITNIEFQAISKDSVVAATTPIVLVDFNQSEANKKHLVLTQVMEEIEIKAKPSVLPQEINASAASLANLEDKITISDLILPKGVVIADQELDQNQIVASLYDPAKESATRDAESETESIDAADVPSDSGKKPAEA